MNRQYWLPDDEYYYIYDKVPRLCIDLVIRTELGVLLSLRSIDPYKGEWSLPGGLIYKQEKIEDAVVRIAKKETGLDVSPDKMLGHLEFFKERQGEHERHTVSIAYEVSINSGELNGDFQSSKMEYFSSLPSNTIDVHRKFIEESSLL